VIKIKRAELQFSTIVYAILALVTLAVVIAVFYTLTKGPISGLFNQGENVKNQGDVTIIKINNVLGGCDPADTQTRCMLGKTVQCDDKGKWVIKGDCDG
jgi:hypothetical protein